MLFKMSCIYCGQKLEAEEEWIGQISTCPKCKHNIVIGDQQNEMLKSPADTEGGKNIATQQPEEVSHSISNEAEDRNEIEPEIENKRPTRTSSFLFICPECSNIAHLPEFMLGKEYECPRCSESVIAQETKERECPLCGKMIKVKAAFCKHCKQEVVPLLNSNTPSQKIVSLLNSNTPSQKTVLHPFPTPVLTKNITGTSSSIPVIQASNLQQDVLHDNSKNKIVCQPKMSKTLSLWEYFVQNTFCLPRSAQYKGRACRKEFWGVSLFWSIIFGLFYFCWVICSILGVELYVGAEMALLPISLFYFLNASLPVECRRLHDLGFDATGWIIARCVIFFLGLLTLLPWTSKEYDITFAVLGWIISIIVITIGCLKGNEEKNRFGENPLHEEFRKRKLITSDVVSFVSSICIIIVALIVSVAAKYDSNKAKSYRSTITRPSTESFSVRESYIDSLPSSQRDALLGRNTNSTDKLNAIANILEDGKLEEVISSL